MEVEKKLDRIIEMLTNMSKEETKTINNQLSTLNEWKLITETKNKTRGALIEILRWFGPWGLAFLYVLFNHKLS